MARRKVSKTEKSLVTVGAQIRRAIHVVRSADRNKG